MNGSRFLQRLKHLCKRASSLLMLFQRTPAAQILLPAELNLAGSAAAMDATKLLIATVAGLGAYDSVAGASSLTQVAPSPGSTTMAVSAGGAFTGLFFVAGTLGLPGSWEVVGTLPAGLTFAVNPDPTLRRYATISGTTFDIGNKTVTIRAWQLPGYGGSKLEQQFTLQVTASPGAVISVQPVPVTINRGETTTLTVSAIGDPPLTYQWYQGTVGNTSTPVGTNSSSFTTPALTATTLYWVKVTNAANSSGANSTLTRVTVRQPATIITDPQSVSVNAGQEVPLSVTVTGDAPLTYQWYEGASGVTTKPVGTNAVYTTPPLAETTSYWVKVTNVANPSGALSNAATITVLPPVDPVVFTASSLSTARVGVLYTTTFTAIGGTPPYAWSSVGGSLPAGLVLTTSGTLSGTPTSAGTSTFTLQVEDSTSKTGTKAMTLRVSNLAISTATLPAAVKGVAYSHALAATGGSGGYTWSRVGGAFPDGISVNAAGLISGTTTATADSVVNMQVTDGTGFSVSRVFTLPISTVFIRPVVNPVTFPTVTVGANFSHPVTALNHPKTFTITGLPKGLKATPAGVISGVPEVAGIFNVQMKAANSGGTSPVVTAKLTIKPLPKNMVGTFSGIVARNLAVNKDLGGQIVLTVTANGGYSLKHTGSLPTIPATKGASVVTSVSGRVAAAAPNISIALGGATLNLNINSQTGNLSGSVTATPNPAATITGWRSAWHAVTQPADELAGYYSMALDLTNNVEASSVPQGSGYATFTITSGGTLAIAGKTADGENITQSTFLSDAADFGLFVPQYKGMGTLHGSLKITPDPLAEFRGNRIAGALTWFKPGSTTRTYGPSFSTNLSAEGGYLSSSSKGTVILGLPEIGPALLQFTAGGIAASETSPGLNFEYTHDNKVLPPETSLNPGKTTLSINAATGAVTGTFSLVEPSRTPPFIRAKVPFFGQVVRKADQSIRAAGYFLLPQIPADGQKPAETAILSGGMTIQSDVGAD